MYLFYCQLFYRDPEKTLIEAVCPLLKTMQETGIIESQSVSPGEKYLNDNKKNIIIMK
jgi:hypothetical protein